jgi:hypothetical protein
MAASQPVAGEQVEARRGKEAEAEAEEEEVEQRGTPAETLLRRQK